MNISRLFAPIAVIAATSTLGVTATIAADTAELVAAGQPCVAKATADETCAGVEIVRTNECGPGDLCTRVILKIESGCVAAVGAFCPDNPFN